MILDDGQAVKLVPIAKVPGRGVVFNARRTKPLPDEFLPATQASSLLPVDNNGPWLRSIPRSHDFSSPVIIELKNRYSPILETDRNNLLQKICRPQLLMNP
jgi:hypothetical protein